MNHTPGPFSIRTYGYAQDIKAGTEILATVHHLGTDREAEQEGNAHLIAAAPELLAVLKGMTKAFKRVTETYTPDDPDCEWLAHAHEAIAKAEGRS